MSVTAQQVERGDVVVVSGRRVGEPERVGEILDVLGDPQRPHYAVLWEDGHRSILYPGPATTIERRGRPARPSPELDVAAATRVLVALLRERGTEFELLPHRRTTTAANEARVLGVRPQTVAKTIVAKDERGARIRAVVPASHRLGLSKLAEAVDASSLVLLTEAELTAAYPEFELGAVPPFGGPVGDSVVVDRGLSRHVDVVLDAGVHDTSLRMAFDDLVTVAGAQVADIAAD